MNKKMSISNNLVMKRISLLLMECETASSFIEKISDWVNTDQHVCKSRLPKVHTLMNILTKFNMELENFDLLNQTTCACSERSVKYDNQYVPYILKDDCVSEFSYSSFFNESINERDKNDLMRINCQNVKNINTTVCEDVKADIKKDFVIKDLPLQPKYSRNDEFQSIICHVEDPWSIYVIPKTFRETYEDLIEEMNRYYSGTKDEFRNRQEIVKSKNSYFAVKIDDDYWDRAIIDHKLPDEIDNVTVFCIDRGLTVDISFKNVRSLNEKFMKCHRLCYKLRLYRVDAISDDGIWSQECLDYLRGLIFQKCSVIVVDVCDEELLASLLYQEELLSIVLRKRNLVKLTTCDNPVMQNAENVLETESVCSSFEEDNIGAYPDFDFSHLDLKDEKIICKNYNGGPSKTCFKGNRCKKIHEKFNKDGYTVEKQIVYIIPEIDLSILESAIATVFVTEVLDYKKIYVQFIEVEADLTIPSGNLLQISYVGEMHRNLNEMLIKLNNENIEPSYSNYYPAIGETVIARYQNTSWERARIKSVSKNTVELFYVDYGIFTSVDIRDVVKMEKEYSEVPSQAVMCSIIDSDCFKNNQKEIVTDHLRRLILNKKVRVIVKCAVMDMLEVIVVDDNGIDIASVLRECVGNSEKR